MNPMRVRGLVVCFVWVFWIATGLLTVVRGDITFASEVGDGKLFVTCSTSDETVELGEEGDTAVFPQSNGGGVKCNVIVGVSLCAQSLQADLDPSSGLVDAKDSYTWTVTEEGISLDNHPVIYGWMPGCFPTSSVLPLY